MLEFKTTKESIDWLAAKENRVLVIRSKQHKFCEDYYANEFLPFSLSKPQYEFACIDDALFDEEIVNVQLENRHIIGLGAPLPIEYLNKLLSN